MKGGLKIAGIVIAAIIILAVIISFSINGLIRSGVETAGSSALGVDVKLGGADLSLLGGRMAMSDFKVANPKGFATDSLIELKHAEVTVRPSDLLGDEITIESIIAESPSVTIEQSLNGTNAKVIMGNIQAGEPKEEKPEKEKPKEDKPEKEKTYRIKLLRITGAKVTFASFLTAKQPVTVPLPEIRIEDLSNADGTGLTLAKVFERVLVEIIQTALKEGKGIIPASISNDVIGDVSQFVPEFAGDMMDKAKGLMEEAGEKLKGLFSK